ncbi:MAG: hypothetical protein AAF517_15035, partial [Planctomycetota bacterium]
LNSLVGHRRPSEPDLNVSFADEILTHASGRLVKQEDDGTTLRIDSMGVIRQVRRQSTKRWLEIDVIDVVPVGEDQFLPGATAATLRDPKTGDVIWNRNNQFRWKQVGNYYLPAHSFTIEVGKGGSRELRTLSFSKHELSSARPSPQSVAKPSVETPADNTFVTSTLHRPLPEPTTSFGAAVVEEYLYSFSGHDGEAHGFGRDALIDHFRRIRFDDPKAEWEELAKHEPAQSTALITDGTFIYRVGGLTFLKGEDDKAIFKSTTHFARYDVNLNKWTDLAPLPKPRSSLDAAVVGRKVFVAGGWNLQGESSRDAPWHEDIECFDLDHPEKGWKSLDGPGYVTRALSVAAHRGRLFVMGGIQRRGFTRKTSIFDPGTGAWSEGPELHSDSRSAGFATSSFATGGKLYMTGSSGVLYQLSADEKQWNVASRLIFPRMFLRLLPASNDRLLAVGGLGTGMGRVPSVESISLKRSSGPRAATWSVKFGGKAKHSQTLVLSGSKLYAFGGNASRRPHDFSKKAFVDEAFAFNLSNQSFERLEDLPEPMQSGIAMVNRQTSEHRTIALAGGLGWNGKSFGSRNKIFSFDPESKSWSEVESSLPAPRAMFEGVAHENAIWMFGGSDSGRGGQGLSSSVLHWWGDSSEVTPLPKIEVPTPRRSFGGAVLGDEYFLVGGLTDDLIAQTVDVFHFTDRTWREASAPNVARVFPSLAEVQGKLYLYGGFARVNKHFAPAPSLEVYDPATDQWSIISESLPGIAESMSMIGFGERLLFYGIDSKEDGVANFALLVPSPLSAPSEVAAMCFSGRRNRDSSAETVKMLMRRDRNKVGSLSRKELGARMASLLEKGDTDRDGALTYAEAKNVIEAQAKEERENEKKDGDSEAN